MSAPIMVADGGGSLRASSFYAGMRLLPKPEREAIFAVYRFCRLVDDIADDTARPRAERAAQLAAWGQRIAALYASGETDGAAGFLQEAVGRFGLAQADFQAVIAGMAQDVAADPRWPAFAEFDHYCDCVASAVGRLCVRIFGMEHGVGLELAHHLGRALQFTNVLRDLDEDAQTGRVYLPREALAAAGMAGDPADPQGLMADPRLDRAARWLAARARGHFDEARAILAARPAGRRLAPWLMLSAYADVLARMEAQGWQAPRRRLRARKHRLLAAALWYGLAR